MKQRLDVLILGLVAMGVILLVAIYGAKHIDLAPVFMLIIYTGLMAITMFYVYYTAKILKATKEQADASVKMAKAMTKPRLTPYFRFVGDFDSERKVAFEAEVHNDGDGPAYDLEPRIEDEAKPPSKLLTGGYMVSDGNIVSDLRGRKSASWFVPDPRFSFSKSNQVQRRFFIIKYKDVDGEYEVCRQFVLETGENDKPIARPERVSKKTLQKRSFEEELP